VLNYFSHQTRLFRVERKKEEKEKSEKRNEAHCGSDLILQFFLLQKKSFSSFIYCHLAVWHCNRDVLLDRSQQLNVSSRVSVAMNSLWLL
jgi:hypothetical protein